MSLGLQDLAPFSEKETRENIAFFQAWNEFQRTVDNEKKLENLRKSVKNAIFELEI